MASSNILLPEEQFQCSICLEVLTDPITTPCGHNFCQACISGYWKSTEQCQCPMCKETFDKKPKLKINTTLREVVNHFKGIQVRDRDESPAAPGEVACDVCTVTKLKALKSCMECLTSFCETHLQPHQIAPALKRHKLINPVENLEDRMCKKHKKPLELFCRTEQMCVCQFCTVTDHKGHHTVPLKKEFGEKKAELGRTKNQMQQMIQKSLQKVKEIKHSMELSNRDAEREREESEQVFTTLVRSMQRSQAEVSKMIGEKQKATMRQAESLIKALEQEITELQRRCSELDQLSHTKDHLHLLQSSPSLCPPTSTKDWPDVSITQNKSKWNVQKDISQLDKKVRRALSELEEKLNNVLEKSKGDDLKRLQQYAVDVTMDPDTAHPLIIVSGNGKLVRTGHFEQNHLYNLKRFRSRVAVLAKEGFSSGKFYYEVQVKGKTGWNVGVAKESINRKIENRYTEQGFWTVWLSFQVDYEACTDPHTPLSLKSKPEKLGVFVDYEEGQVSFYDVDTRSHIFSFTGCTFTEKLYPYLNPFDDYDGSNSAPMIITPVNQTP
uniref:E3 ubiquitin-protein ligase TRIM39-like n=1 Tax=Oncorhynchus tshawytscha TaxID=74940 RepID=A0A8C8GJD4_ONCTS